MPIAMASHGQCLQLAQVAAWRADPEGGFQPILSCLVSDALSLLVQEDKIRRGRGLDRLQRRLGPLLLLRPSGRVDGASGQQRSGQRRPPKEFHRCFSFSERGWQLGHPSIRMQSLDHARRGHSDLLGADSTGGIGSLNAALAGHGVVLCQRDSPCRQRSLICTNRRPGPCR